MKDNYFYNRNPDNVFIRSFIVALRNFLTEKISLKNYFRDSVQSHPIRFYYDAGGDERFLQDIYVSSLFEDRIQSKPVEGNIDEIPRGVFKIDSLTINSAELTNRFVSGKKVILDSDGNLRTYTSNMNVIPLTASISCEIILSRKIEVFKVWQEVVKNLYKLHVIDFLFENQYIRCQIGFPEDMTQELTNEYSYGDSTAHKMTFSLESSLYIPVFDDVYFALPKSQNLRNFGINVSIAGEQTLPNNNVIEGVIGDSLNVYPKTFKPIESVLYEDISDKNSTDELKDWLKGNFTSIETDVEKQDSAYDSLVSDELKQDFYEQNNVPVPQNLDDNLHYNENFGVFNNILNHTIIIRTYKPENV